MKYEILKPNSGQEITKLFTDTFTDSEGPAEGKLIGNLVSELQKTTKPEDILGFIAKDQEKFIGCVFFSRFTFEIQINAFILSPIAIDVKYQKQGIGQKLIRFGINYLKKNNVELLLTYGDPNFYSKVGFKNIPEAIIKSPLKLTCPEGWLAQSLVRESIVPIKGNTMCVPALNNQKYW